MDSVKTLMTHLSSAIAESAADPSMKGLRMFSVVFSFPSIAAVGRERAVRAVDAFLEGIQLIVFDAQQWLPSDFRFSCPNCHEGLPDTKGWSDATSSKGMGDIHTVYLASRVRMCKNSAKGCNKKTAEHMMLHQLPREVRSLLPIIRTTRSGLTSELATLMMCLLPCGVPFQALATAVECLTQTNHAEQVGDISLFMFSYKLSFLYSCSVHLSMVFLRGEQSTLAKKSFHILVWFKVRSRSTKAT